MVVLDEADRMLSETFAEDLNECLGMLPKSGEGKGRQTLLFTATMTDEVKMLKEMERQEGRREVFVCEVDTDKYAFPHLQRWWTMTDEAQIRDPPHTKADVPAPQLLHKRSIPAHAPIHPRV